MRLIDADALKARLRGCMILMPNGEKCTAERAVDTQGTIEAEPVRHGQLDEDKPLTNGDKIRSMTDEELAQHLSSYICDNRESGDCRRFRNCEECKLSWIRQEVGEDAG